jgi:hypothetical protein
MKYARGIDYDSQVKHYKEALDRQKEMKSHFFLYYMRYATGLKCFTRKKSESGQTLENIFKDSEKETMLYYSIQG